MSNLDWLSFGNSASDALGLTAAYQTAQDSRLQIAQYSIAQASTYLTAGKNDQAITAFKKAKLTEADALVQARVARILRYGEKPGEWISPSGL